MGKNTFGVKVGVDKVLHANNQTEQDRLETMHQAMRLAYISDHAAHAIGSASPRQQENENYDIQAMRQADREFTAHIDENIGEYKNNIHTNLDKTLQLEDGLDQLNQYITVMEVKYDPEIVAERRKENEPDVEVVYETEMARA